MASDPSTIQKFTPQGPDTWSQVGDHQASLGYVADEAITVRQGEFLHMPAGVDGAFDVREDVEAVCVHHPADGVAGRTWTGAELLPADESIRPVDIGAVWP